MLTLIIMIAVVLGAIGLGMWVTSLDFSWLGRPAPTIPYAPSVTRSAFDRFLAALKERAGTTAVSDFASGRDYFCALVAEWEGCGRLYQYDCATHALSEPDAPEVCDEQSVFDLASLDVDAIERLHARAWQGAPGDVASSWLSVERPNPGDEPRVSIRIGLTRGKDYLVDGNLDGTVVSEERER